MPSFVDYPSALPYFSELHNNELLNELCAELKSTGQKSTDVAAKPEEQEAPNPFMDAFDQMKNLTLTDNGDVSHLSTMDPCLDLYYGDNRTSNDNLQILLQNAYASDSDFTLHLIFYSRSIHRGKSLVSAFCKSFCWLLKNHPRTALANLHVLVDGTIRTDFALKQSLKEDKKKIEAEKEGWEVTEVDTKNETLERRDFKTHGYWKDLCTLLTIGAQDELNGPENAEYKALIWPRMIRDSMRKKNARDKCRKNYNHRKTMEEDEAKKDRELCIQKAKDKATSEKAAAKEKRISMRKERNDHVTNLLENDKLYRALHFTIARLFADQLKKDLDQLKKNEICRKQEVLKGRHALGFNISMASKWAPSLCNSHDKHTFLATSIAELLFPPENNQDPEESRVHYLNKVRDLYRKTYLIPLRKALDLTEHYMAKDKWNGVDYGHIPAVCLEKNMARFFLHDPDSVINYLDEVAAGTKKVSGETVSLGNMVHRALNPNVSPNLSKILRKLPGTGNKLLENEAKLVNGQWNTLLEGIRNTSQLDVTKNSKKKKIDLGECISVCDVSGSMCMSLKDPGSIPYNVAIGLSLLTTNLAKPPFKGAIITFSEKPNLFKVNTSATFSEQVKELTRCDAGFNTNLRAVFTNVLLPMAVKYKIKQEDMVKRLFIFTDMQFDEGCKDESSYDYIKSEYQKAGYEVPEIVWWNLSPHTNNWSNTDDWNDIGDWNQGLSAPVTKNQENATLLSGFSSSMLKTFLDGDIPNNDEDTKDEDTKDEGVKVEKKKKTPLSFAKEAAYHESFQNLVVID